MRTHASAQLIGGRSHQCDATATYTHAGVRAYALLDGIGSSDEIRDWTRTTARRLARAAAVRADAEAGLRVVHSLIADERAQLGWRADDEPCAVAVVAVVVPGELVQVAWCGDSRAYFLGEDGEVQQMTSDHNNRQMLLDMGLEPGRYARNIVTSYLGEYHNRRPQIGAVLGPAAGRLLLASDGAYEPLEDASRDLGAYLTGGVRRAAQGFVEAAIEHGSERPDNATVLVADFG